VGLVSHPHLLFHRREAGRLTAFIERRGRDHGTLVVVAELAEARRLAVSVRAYEALVQALWIREMEPEDGVLAVYGPGDESTPAFTDLGLENLRELIRLHRERAERRGAELAK
jgi:hypothetical protein